MEEERHRISAVCNFSKDTVWTMDKKGKASTTHLAAGVAQLTTSFTLLEPP